jgi:hypothetical protein
VPSTPAALAIAAVVTCAGCGAGGTGTTSAGGAVNGSTPTGAQAAAATVGTPAATAALTASARQVRAQVAAVTAPLVRRGGRGTVVVDDAAPCRLDAPPNAWPRRWGYSVDVHVTDTLAVTTARTAGITLKAQGWTVRRNGNSSAVVDLDAGRRGAVLHVVGGRTPGELDVEAYGACIGPGGAAVTASAAQG